MKRHFLTGMALLLPLVLTFWIVQFIVDFLTAPFLGITEYLFSSTGLHHVRFFFLSEEQALAFFSKIFILVFLFAFIIGIGAVGRYFLFKYVMKCSDQLLHRIPVVSSVYKTSQELVQTIFTSDNKAFKQVVLVPFPNSSSKSLGLLTRDDVTGDRVPVFIPTTPNPTSGYLILYAADQVIPLEMSVETALRYIISCGVLIDPSIPHHGFNPRRSSTHKDPLS